jgi:uncharacterized OB-fold protein
MAAIVEYPPTAASFARLLAEHRLMATRCTSCGAIHLPPRGVCAACHGETQEWVALSGRGTLAGFTSIFVAPTAMAAAGYDRNHPYLSGIVRLEEGPSISARIVGMDAAAPDLAWIGSSLEVTWIDEGDGEEKQTTLAFAPV